VAHDRYEEARAVTAALEDRPLDDPIVNATILGIWSGLEEEHKEGPFRFKELFQWGEVQNFRRLLIIISMQMGQQFSGSNMLNVSNSREETLRDPSNFHTSTTVQSSSKTAWDYLDIYRSS
jgi:hypothetical protein